MIWFQFFYFQLKYWLVSVVREFHIIDPNYLNEFFSFRILFTERIIRSDWYRKLASWLLLVKRLLQALSVILFNIIKISIINLLIVWWWIQKTYLLQVTVQEMIHSHRKLFTMLFYLIYWYYYLYNSYEKFR